MKTSLGTTTEIRNSISAEQPAVLANAKSSLDQRLDFLSSKANDPRIRKHPPDRYALPFSVRNEFNDGLLHIRTVTDNYNASINDRFTTLGLANCEHLRLSVIACVRHAILQTYHKQALNFANSFTDRNFDSDIRVFEFIGDFIDSLDIDETSAEKVRDATSAIYRNICYSSNGHERDYLNLLMKYFTIQFVMDGDQAVSHYFSDMATRLRIYVGTDILVRCLSEILVPESSRGMTNSLRLLRSAGVKLRVTRQTLGEVFSHIRHSTTVFRADYESWFLHATLDSVINCDRILIRAFFYARLEPDRHKKPTAPLVRLPKELWTG